MRQTSGTITTSSAVHVTTLTPWLQQPLLHCACDHFNPLTASSPCYTVHVTTFNPLTASSLLSCDLVLTSQVLLKLIAFRLKYFTHKFEVFDGIVVMVSFALDIASLYVCVKCMCMCCAIYGSSESHLQAHQYNSNCLVG